MMRRLILGDGSVGRTLADHVIGQPGDLFVVTDDRGWVTTLGDSSIPAVEGDPTDPRQYPSAIDIVVVAASDAERNEQIAAIAREVFPEATLITAIGLDATDAQRDRLAALSDQLINPVADVASRLLDATGNSREGRIGHLLSALRSLSKPLAVVAHDNPDPDAIASALALAKISESVGVPAEACYFGEITHQENKALVNLLSLPLRHLTTETFSADDYGAIALVDHSRPGVNDSLPLETAVRFVVDHHPPRAPLDETSSYLDIRPGVGSTSTIMVEYFQRLGMIPDEPLATALLYGIQTDTKQFTREVSEADFVAAAFLSRYADERALARIESPSVSSSVLGTLATAIRERDVRGTALATCVGRLTDRDALAQAADELLNMDGITTVLVFGYTEGVIYVSGRTRGSTIDLGETLREALGQIGSAGGHANMAGAQLSMGILESAEQEAELSDIVHELVAERFFEALETAPGPATYMIDPPLRFQTE